MRTLITCLLLGLAAASATADNPTPQAAGTTPAKPIKSSPAASATSTGGTAGTGAAPNAGGNGGGVGSNKGVSGQQIGPKKPKCPDPTVACPAEKVIGK